MWIGACTSSIGTWMQTLAQSWLVYKLSKDPFYLGLDAFLGQVPIILLSLVGGVFRTVKIAAICCCSRSSFRWDARSCLRS